MIIWVLNHMVQTITSYTLKCVKSMFYIIFGFWFFKCLIHKYPSTAHSLYNTCEHNCTRYSIILYGFNILYGDRQLLLLDVNVLWMKVNNIAFDHMISFSLPSYYYECHDKIMADKYKQIHSSQIGYDCPSIGYNIMSISKNYPVCQTQLYTVTADRGYWTSVFLNSISNEI